VRIARIALDVPLDDVFDFRLPAGIEAPLGSLVVVPFGRSRKVGVVIEHAAESAVPAERLRDVEAVVADVPAIGAPELDLYRFCARYYQRPLGEVVATALPPRLRQVKRREIVPPGPAPGTVAFTALHEPTTAQKEAIAHVLAGRDRFHPVLLEGVTGSGKTEVYLQLIADTLARGRQALLLVPEIGLTPQFEEHVRARFPGATLLTTHSHLSEGERARAWLAARSGAAHVILGTRLSVLSAFRDLGLIVVDEEHDLSYKQQEGMRYSARDVAVVRAQRRQGSGRGGRCGTGVQGPSQRITEWAGKHGVSRGRPGTAAGRRGAGYADLTLAEEGLHTRRPRSAAGRGQGGVGRRGEPGAPTGVVYFVPSGEPRTGPGRAGQ